jgi:hypothetical protein
MDALMQINDVAKRYDSDGRPGASGSVAARSAAQEAAVVSASRREDRLNVSSVQVEALFASWLQPSEALTAERVAEANNWAVRQFGIGGCAGRMAQEFGDHPDAAAGRMRWVRRVAAEALAAASPGPSRRPVQRKRLSHQPGGSDRPGPGGPGTYLAAQARPRAAGLPADRIRRTFPTASAPVRSLIPVTPGNQASRAIVVLGTIILYLGLATYGGWVISGVLEEKSSRVVEVILAAVRPLDLLAGKVMGIGLLGLGQFAAVALTGTIAASDKEEACCWEPCIPPSGSSSALWSW